jgi:ABC-2 type transport system permease protein
VDGFRQELQANAEEGSQTADSPFANGLVPVQAIDIHSLDGDAGSEQPKRSMVAYYAAGISVMFLLFSMSGAAGSLLDEEESGVIERLLSTRAGMPSLLAGKWLFYGLLGFVQVLMMFGWGSLFFGLDLSTPQRIGGLLAMALVTALAAAAFGLVLATVCRTRGQLSGVSTVLIMLMSAIGGSMFPRFMMPELMTKASLLTFNGWALDGFLKVFWYDDPEVGLGGALLDLLPQLAMLAAMTAFFLAIARRMARRWESV